MIIHLLDAHAGRHAVGAAAAAAVAAKTPFFRRMRLRRKPIVPEAASPVSGTLPASLLTESQSMATGEFDVLDARVDAVLRRPVNGRSLPDAPRRQPGGGFPFGTTGQPADAQPAVYGERPVADIVAAEEQARNDAAAAWYQTVKPRRTTLERVRDGLRNLSDDRPDATRFGGWQ